MDYPSHGASRRFLMAMQAWKKLKWPRVIVSRRGSSQVRRPAHKWSSIQTQNWKMATGSRHA